MAEAQRTYPDRIRWFASLPWEYPDRAVEELARSCDEGAAGVMVLANVAGRSLTEDAFAPIWAEIDRRALPVLVHPGEPPGADLMDMGRYDLSWSVGFMFDTTLAFVRMIFDGFLDRYPDLKLIAAHGGGTLPYLVGRFEKGDAVELAERRRMTAHPTDYLRRIWYDCITYDLGRAALPDLGRRRGSGPVRDGLAAPGPRHRRARSRTRRRCRRTSATRSAARRPCGCSGCSGTGPAGEARRWRRTSRARRPRPSIPAYERVDRDPARGRAEGREAARTRR